MKKHILDLTVKAVERVHERYVLIRLTDKDRLPDMVPGQFVNIRVDDSPSTFLRRPISINFVDQKQNELWLLVACVGEGTRRMAQLKAGDKLNCVLPLGNGWSNGASIDSPLLRGGVGGGAPLLVGGGVGVAPLLYLGAVLKEQGITPTFLLGARTKNDLLMLGEFEKYGRVFVTTEDGSMGEKGFVTNHSVLQTERFDMIHCCGPTPMMKAVARYARQNQVECEVSLENLMACGVGACLCCVEKIHQGSETAQPTNVCVCKEGPVFNIKKLLWQD